MYFVVQIERQRFRRKWPLTQRKQKHSVIPGPVIEIISISQLVSIFYFSSMATNSYTATVATWCILSILIVVSVAYLLKKILPWFPPSWIAVPFAGTFLFVFSAAFYLQWLAVSNYSPADPFSSKPPAFESVFYSALIISVLLSFLSIGTAFVAYASWLTREKGTTIKIA